MRIDAIKVRNFRGADVRRWEFSPSINALVGENGRGKTALLDALAVGVGAYFLGVDGVSAWAIARDDVRLEEDSRGRETSRTTSGPRPTTKPERSVSRT